MPPVLLDFSANAALRSITLARATLGPEPPASSQAVAVRWPQEGLARLHLWQCQWLPGFSRHVAAHAMAHTLVELVLNVECTYEPIDLGAFVALRCLKLLGDPFDLGEVRPPLKAPLARLIVQGRNQEPFWARMAASTYATLRHLGVTVPRRGDSGPLPFGAMPNLTHLTFRDPTRRSREAAVTSLSALDLPADNIIGTLTLEGYVLQPTLELVPLPNLRRLKLGAHVPSPRWASFLDEVLSRRPAPWPHLERVTVLASTRSAATVACLQPVLARHGIALHAERVEAPPSAALDF
jgi:hypothetical protein